jgi:Fe-S oxidoreductase
MIHTSGQRRNWAAGLHLKNASKEKVDVLYHVGCLTSYDKNKLAVAIAKILQKAEINFGIFGESEICCGGRAYQMGYKEDALNQARKNMSRINQAGIKTLVTGCAECYQAFKVIYDQFNLKGELEVFHISEYISKLLKEGKLSLTKSVDSNITYHDPCNLGRLGEPWIHWKGEKVPGVRFVFNPPKEYRRGTKGIYEPPREVLKSIPGIKLTEMTRIREYAWCCGAGGGVKDSNPEFALWTARERIDEAKSAGVEAIVTACPWCEKNFNDAIKDGGYNLKVYDIVELVEQSI